jgi:hypothetical protein
MNFDGRMPGHAICVEWELPEWRAREPEGVFVDWGVVPPTEDFSNLGWKRPPIDPRIYPVTDPWPSEWPSKEEAIEQLEESRRFLDPLWSY